MNNSNFNITNINGIKLQFELFIEQGIIYNCSVYYIKKLKLKTILDIDIDDPKTVDDTILECFKKFNQIIKCEDCDRVHYHDKHLEKDLCGDCSWQHKFNQISKVKLETCFICVGKRLKSMIKDCTTCNNKICSYCVKKTDNYCPYCRSFDLFA